MKILIATGIFPPDIGGPATYSKLLSEELPRHNIDVEILSFGEVRHLPTFVRHIAYGVKLLRRGRNVDVIFAQDPFSVGLPASVAAFLLQKKFILKIVGDFAWEQWQQSAGGQEACDKFITPDEFQVRKFDFVTEIMRRVERYVARSANKIIVPSEYLKKIVSMWDVDPNKIFVIYNAVDFKEIKFSKEDARNELGVSGKIIVSAGRLVPWKGFGMLIKMMGGLIKNFHDLQLIIVGDGPERESLKSQVSNLGLSGKIIFTGSLPKEKLLLYLRASDIFVLNTAYEGFSHQIVEAMALGLPVLTTSIGGNPEIITSGTNGFLVPFDSEKEFQEKISLLFSSPESISTISVRGKDRALLFTRERLINEVVKFLNTL